MKMDFDSKINVVARRSSFSFSCCCYDNWLKGVMINKSYTKWFVFVGMLWITHQERPPKPTSTEKSVSTKNSFSYMKSHHLWWSQLWSQTNEDLLRPHSSINIWIFTQYLKTKRLRKVNTDTSYWVFIVSSAPCEAQTESSSAFLSNPESCRWNETQR